MEKGINGIPVKIVDAEKKALTVYFASFRKAPRLKKISKDLFKLQCKQEKMNALETVYSNELAYCTADTYEEKIKRIEDISGKLEKVREDMDNSVEELEKIFNDFLTAGLTGAGYPKIKAEEIAELIPQERMAELMQASRMGTMKMLDFFTESQSKN